MKKIIIFAVLICVLPLFAAGDVNKIVEKFTKEKGFSTLDEVYDFKMSGKTQSRDKTFYFHFYFLKPNYYRMNVTGVGASLYMVFDGKKGWNKQNVMPTFPLDPRTQELLFSFADFFFSPAYNIELNKYKFKYDSLSKFGGRDVYKISRIDSNGIFMDMLIDKSNYELLKSEEFIDIDGNGILSSIVYDKYREINKIKIPMEIEHTFNGEISKHTIDSVSFNIGMTPYDFRAPK